MISLLLGYDFKLADVYDLVGPFVNDALAGIGKAGSGEFTKLTEYCTSQKQEVEADVVSARYAPPLISSPPPTSHL